MNYYDWREMERVANARELEHDHVAIGEHYGFQGLPLSRCTNKAQQRGWLVGRKKLDRFLGYGGEATNG